MRRWSPRTGYGRTKKLLLIGVLMLPMSASVPSATPMMRPMAPRIWAKPIVATVSTRRDERAKRRITRTSMAAPDAAPTMRPSMIASQ